MSPFVNLRKVIPIYFSLVLSYHLLLVKKSEDFVLVLLLDLPGIFPVLRKEIVGVYVPVFGWKLTRQGWHRW